MDSDAPVVISERLQALSGRLASDAVGRNVRAPAGLLAYGRNRPMACAMKAPGNARWRRSRCGWRAQPEQG